jgi:hypothetical protein
MGSKSHGRQAGECESTQPREDRGHASYKGTVTKVSDGIATCARNHGKQTESLMLAMRAGRLRAVSREMSITVYAEIITANTNSTARWQPAVCTHALKRPNCTREMTAKDTQPRIEKTILLAKPP